VNLRKTAGLLAAAGLVVGLLGSGVGASFFDQVTGTENISVGTFSCIIVNPSNGTIAGDQKSVTYTAPAITSSSAGNAPFSFTVQNTGSIAQVLSVAKTSQTGNLTPKFSDMPASVTPASLAPGATALVSTGIQWTALDNSDLGRFGSMTWTVSCNEFAGSTVVVHPSDMATSSGDVLANPTKWFYYNDETDAIDNSLGSMVAGPGTPPAGSGSSQISVTGTQRRNLATYQFSGTPLANITALKFSTYNPSAGNGGSANRSGYLQFNVDFNGSDSWQSRLVFLPTDNGAVVQNSWQEWDAINGGNALYRYSGANWPVCAGGGAGTTTKTLSSIISGCAGVRIRVTDSFMGVRVGEPYADGYTENIDAFKFGTSGGTTVYDFEP
jgi:hypothetical protein